MKPQVFWFIQATWPTKRGGQPFFYSACGYTRRQAIAEHVADWKKPWRERYRAGDRAVKCRVQPLSRGERR